MHELFIYGTLKRGRSQHQRLAGQRFISVAETESAYRLLDLGWYPGLARVVERDGKAIQGEIWQVSEACLQELDLYEGDDYERIPVKVTFNGRACEMEAYVLRAPDWSRPDAGVSWD